MPRTCAMRGSMWARVKVWPNFPARVSCGVFLRPEWCDEGANEIERKALGCGESQEVGE